jgi:hypothetical protein
MNCDIIATQYPIPTVTHVSTALWVLVCEMEYPFI